MVLWYILAAAMGALTSIWWTKLVQAVVAKRAGQAALLDFGLMMLGSLTTQAWFAHEGNFTILLTFDAVAAIGTYVTVRYSRDGSPDSGPHLSGPNHHLPCK